jgi:AraC family transcriptional regulator, regulatory protein of adaptative response / DNA-3-methyladenine glycosylase II
VIDSRVIVLDPERCYRAVQSRDTRFDGWFYTAVRTTGIYCRPSCPAVTPKRTNVEFYPSSAAAQQRGFRACKRCRPDAAPGSPEWNVRGDVVARAMRLIADGVVDRDGVTGLAARLGYSPRHLTRLLTDELGAGPLALARAQRAQTARILIETTAMPITDVAFAAGFGSIRQFNDTIRDVFAAAPSELRRRTTAEAGMADIGAVSVRLATRRPFAVGELLSFVGSRAVPGIEHWDGTTFRRALALPRGHGTAAIRPADGFVHVEYRLTDWRDLAPAVERTRRLLDLDADPVAVDDLLGADPALTPLVRATPGLRAAGSVDPGETALRAVLGQQVSIAGARTLLGRIVAAAGDALAVEDPVLTHVGPDMDRVRALDGSVLAMPASRRRTVHALADAIATGELVLDHGVDRERAFAQLVALPGIGPWTAGYVVMRGLGDPDVFLASDLGVRHALDRAGLTIDDADRWRPWRTYALHHLWASLAAPRHAITNDTTDDTTDDTTKEQS